MAPPPATRGSSSNGTEHRLTKPGMRVQDPPAAPPEAHGGGLDAKGSFVPDGVGSTPTASTRSKLLSFPFPIQGSRPARGGQIASALVRQRIFPSDHACSLHRRVHPQGDPREAGTSGGLDQGVVPP